MTDKPNTLRADIEKVLYKHVTSLEAVSYEDLTDALLSTIYSSLEKELPEEIAKMNLNVVLNKQEVTGYREGWNKALIDVKDKLREVLKP